MYFSCAVCSTDTCELIVKIVFQILDWIVFRYDMWKRFVAIEAQGRIQYHPYQHGTLTHIQEENGQIFIFQRGSDGIQTMRQPHSHISLWMALEVFCSHCYTVYVLNHWYLLNAKWEFSLHPCVHTTKRFENALAMQFVYERLWRIQAHLSFSLSTTCGADQQKPSQYLFQR